MGAGAPPAIKVSLGDGTIYVAAYSGNILAIDEATEKVAAIPLKTGFPFSVQVSSDAANLYALNADMESMEVIDIGKQQSVDTFTVSETVKALFAICDQQGPRWRLRFRFAKKPSDSKSVPA